MSQGGETISLEQIDVRVD